MKSTPPSMSILFEWEVFDPLFTIRVEDYPPYRHTLGLSPVSEVSPLPLPLPSVFSVCSRRS